MRIAKASHSLVAMLVALAFLLAACGGGSTPTASAPSSGGSDTSAAATDASSAAKTMAPAATAVLATQASTEAPAASGGLLNPADALLSAMKAQLSAGSYRANMAVADLSTNKTFTNTIEFQAPNRYHLFNGVSETIAVSPTTYMKVPNSGWQAIPIDMASVLQNVRDPQLVDQFSSAISNVQLVGPDLVNGTPTMVYQFTENLNESNSTNKIWVDLKTNLPVKLESDGEFQGEKTHTVVLYEYDPNIKIEAPTVSK